MKHNYICDVDGELYSCEKWRDNPSADFFLKVRRKPSLPTIDYKQLGEKINCINADDYQFLMACQNKTYYVLKDLKKYIENCNAYSIKVHNRLTNIKCIQEQKAKYQAEEYQKTFVFDPSNFNEEITWSEVSSLRNREIGRAHV